MRSLAAFLVLMCPAYAQDIVVPSGQPVQFVELIKDAEGPAGETWRFRFIAPDITRDGGGVPLDVTLDDMHAVCDAFVAPALEKRGLEPAQVIISFADKAVEFGTADPDATQFFEAFSLDGQTCIWEGF